MADHCVNSRSERQSREVVLTATDVAVTYASSRGPTTAVTDLNLSVREGEFVSILGPSGCGKSTFLGVAAGLLQASRGAVRILDKEVVAPRPDVGIVFQKPTLLPWATVEENVMIPVVSLGLKRSDSAEKARALLKLVGLGAFAHHYPNELSGGMQQRVAIARALIRDPSVLLMDEPFAALDAMTRERMSFELEQLWVNNRKSVLFITHSIPEAVFLSDRIMIMSASPGTIIREVEVTLTRPRTAETMAAMEYTKLCGDIRGLFLELLGGH